MANRLPRPTCPQEAMTRFNEAGEAYWLENLRLTDGTVMEQVDVMGFGPNWIKIQKCTPDANAPVEPLIWVNLAHVVSFELVEG
jgi:hypothetical protein